MKLALILIAWTFWPVPFLLIREWNMRRNARAWPLHRDRQHRDRMRAQHLADPDEAKIAELVAIHEGLGGHIHNGAVTK